MTLTNRLSFAHPVLSVMCLLLMFAALDDIGNMTETVIVTAMLFTLIDESDGDDALEGRVPRTSVDVPACPGESPRETRSS